MVSMKIVRKRHKKLPTTIGGPRRVKVGFPAGEASGSNIEKAVWNEFGTRGGGWGGPIPERPFMRNAMRENRGKYRDAMSTAAPKILRGDAQLGPTLSKLGIEVQRDIKAEIGALSSPPNSPVTIALKGSDKPLIDSGDMRKAVTYKVDR